MTIERYADEAVHEEIDGFVYTSIKFPCSKALDLLARTVKLLGADGLRSVVRAQAGALGVSFPGLVAGAAGATLYDAAPTLALGMLEDPNLFRDLIARTRVNRGRMGAGGGGELAKLYETHFAGELPHLVRVCIFVLTHNFAGFTIGSLLTSGSRTPDTTATDEQPPCSPTPTAESISETSTR